MASCIDYVSTQSYRIAPGALKDLKYLTAGFGRKYLIVTGCNPVLEEITKKITDSFEKTLAENAREFTNPLGKKGGLACDLPNIPTVDDIQVEYKFVNWDQIEVTYDNCKALSEVMKEYEADVVVAVGGGKVMDLTRAATYYIDPYFCPRIVLCPTSISSNACATGLSIIYSEDGREMKAFWNLHQKPDAVIIDTELISRAPARIMAAGIGDQFASFFETAYSLKQLGLWDTADLIAQKHVEACGETLFRYAAEAYESVKRQEITIALENVISCTSYIGGPFVSVSVANVAHILDEALIEFEPCRKLLHGEVVGYATLVQEIYNDQYREKDNIYKLIDLFQQIGIPCTFEELGIAGKTHEEILRVCKLVENGAMAGLTPIHHDPVKIAQAVMDYEKLVAEYLAKKK